MKVEIVVTYEDITLGELQEALQGLRDIEQKDPERIWMFAMINTPDLATRHMTELLQRLNPPLPFIQKITRNSSLTSTREIYRAGQKQEGGETP